MPIVIPAPTATLRLNIVNAKHLRIIYFGTPLFAVHPLRELLRAGWPIAAVVTAPDRPVGRRMLLTPSPVKVAAQELGVAVLSPMKLSEESFWNAFTELRPDLCIVAAYNKILPKRYLDIPRLGFLNIHPSLLPQYRGPSPVRTAILDGRTESGVSIMILDEQTDHGPLIGQESWHIPSGLDAPACEEELFRRGSDLLVRLLPDYVSGAAPATPQHHDHATFTHMFTRQDGRLDWSASALRVDNRIRALSDSPGTWTMWGDKVLNIAHAHIATEVTQSHPPGTVILHGGQLAVACADGLLILESLQLEGSTRQSARDFMNGRPAIIGAVLT